MTIKEFISKILNFFKPKPKKSIIHIKVGDKIVGAIQSISIHEMRSSDGQRPPFTSTVYRARFDKSRLEEAFSRGVFHANAQKNPLQISVDDGKVKTTLRNSWVEDTGNVYSTHDWVIVEKMTVVSESSDSEKK